MYCSREYFKVKVDVLSQIDWDGKIGSKTVQAIMKAAIEEPEFLEDMYVCSTNMYEVMKVAVPPEKMTAKD